MTSSREEIQRRAFELLPQILDLAPDSRPAFLARCCAGEPALEVELLELLAVDEDLVERLDLPAVEALEDGTPLAPEPEEEPELRAIGPYEILEELGRGGSGVVYLAVRADGEYRRRVAVKLLRRGLGTEGLLRRFRVERQILANLRHPNIAVLYDGGTTADHRPYFVLEYVDGEPIDDYCAARELPREERLELFLKVCGAVQYAHQNLVIHRDLKPVNILVDGEGEPKLLDFGIAKLLDPEPALWESPAADASTTVTGLRPMTPQYASPEQLQGGTVTTATDVYALGLVLYELLTGHRPFTLRGPLDLAGQRAICEEEPPRPSTLDRRLRGDLDTILLTSLAKDPTRRYSSAEHLAEDVRRHLEGLPIRARRPTLGYRLGKLIRRRKGPLAAAAVLVVAGAVFLVQHELQNRRVAQALSRAEAASRVLAEMVLVSQDQSEQSRTRIPLEVLERGSEALGQLSEKTALRAELTAALGRGYLAHQDLERGAPLVREAYDLRREVFGEEDGRVAESLVDLASLEVEASRPREAEALYRRALAIQRERLGPSHPEVSSLENAVAAALYDQGRMEEAEAMYRSALASKRRELGDDHYDVAAIRNNLALALLAQGEGGEAEALFRHALEVSRRSLRETDGQVLAAKLNLAASLEARGRYREAESLQREVLDFHRGSGEEKPLAGAAERLSGSLLAQGKLEEARALAGEALEIQLRLRGERSSNAASAATALAEVLHASGEVEEARKLLKQAIATYRLLGLEHHRRAVEARELLSSSRR